MSGSLHFLKYLLPIWKDDVNHKQEKKAKKELKKKEKRGM